MAKQFSLDTWQIHHLTELLDKGSNIVKLTNRPIILYRQTLEEEEESYEEIVCTLGQDHVVEQVIISGGMVVPEIKQQLVFTIEEYPDRLLNKSKDLFAEVVEQLEEQFQ